MEERRREAVWRVVALVAGLFALVLVRSLVRGWPVWAAVVVCVLAFAVTSRSINALRGAQHRRGARRR